jgi:hypothetical protein
LPKSDIAILFDIFQEGVGIQGNACGERFHVSPTPEFSTHHQ